MAEYVSAKTRKAVVERAKNRCEYCLVPQAGRIAKFHLEHIFPLSHGGNSEFENLASACQFCNLHKGTNIASIDFETGSLTALFNPRTQLWTEHFRFEGAILSPLTAEARVTARILRLNDVERIEERQALLEAELYP